MSTTSDERSPRFSRAILGRILAVVAFVGLGTFAVVQSVSGDKGDSNEVAINTEAEPSEPLQQEPLTIDSSSQSDSNASPSTSMGIGANANKTDFAAPTPKSFNTEFAKPEPKPFPKKTLPPTTTSRLAANKMQPASTRPELTSRPSTGKPIVVAKQVSTETPPPATAFSGQFSGAKPTGQTVATRTQTTPPPSLRPTTRRPSEFQNDNSFGSQSGGTPNVLENVKQKTSDIAQGLRDAGQNSVDNALQKTQGGLESISNAAKSKLINPSQSLRSSLSDRPQPPNAGANQSQPRSVMEPSTPKNASFDSSRGLTPYGKSSTDNSKPSFPAATSRTQLPPTNPVGRMPSTQRRTTPLSSPPPRKPFSRVSAPLSTAPSSNIASSNLRATGTPGDRQLEGVQAPSLTIEKIAPREIQVNQSADFQIVVRNAGRVTANDVQVFDMIPAGTEYVSAVPQPTRTGAQDLRWSLGEMRPGQEKRIKIQLKPIRPGEIGSVAQVTFASRASMRTRVTKPVLHIRQTAQPRVLIGDNVILDVMVENKGDGPAHQVIIQEDVPPQLEFSDGYRELEYEIGTLAPGQSRQVRLSLRAAEIGRLKNVLVATADGGLSAQHAIDMEVIAPQLVATGTGPRRKFLRREATHQFSVENKGTADATNVELVARLPSGLKFLNANNRGKYDPNTHAVYWSLAELTPNVVGSVELNTLPIESGEQKINFEATADLEQKSQTAQSLLVEHLIDVFFDIDDVVDPIEIGSSTNYRIRVINQGTKTATNVRIQVDFPNGIQPVSVDGNLPNEIRGQQIIFNPITSLNPNDEIKLLVQGNGVASGDHRVVVRLQTDGRATPVSKEETTRVYDDR